MNGGINVKYYKGASLKGASESITYSHIKQEFLKRTEEIDGISHNPLRAYEPILLSKKVIVEEKKDDIRPASHWI